MFNWGRGRSQSQNSAAASQAAKPAPFSGFLATHPKFALWLASGAIIVALTSMFAFELRSRYIVAISDAEKVSQSFADVLAEHTARTFEAIERTMRVAESIHNDVVAGRLGPQVANQALRGLQKGSPALLAIGWTNQKGDVIAHSYDGDPVRANIAELPHFFVQRDSKTEGMFIAPLYKSRASGRWISTVSLRLNNSDGSFAGIVTAPLDLSYFARIYRSVGIGSDDAVTLVRRDGAILVREPFVEKSVGQSFGKTKLFSDYLEKSDFGIFQSVSPIDGKDRIFAYRVVPRLPLIMLVLRDRAEVVAEWYDHARVFGPMAAVLIFAVIAGTGLLSRRTEQLTRGSALLNATLNNMHQGLLVVDQNDRIAIYNRRALQLLDLPESLLATRPLSKDVIAYQTQHGEFAKCAELHQASPAAQRSWRNRERIRTRAPERDNSRNPDGSIFEWRSHSNLQGYFRLEAGRARTK